MSDNTSPLLGKIVETNRRGTYKGLSFFTTELMKKIDGVWKQSDVTFSIDIELKYIPSKYKSLWLSKEEKLQGSPDYSYRDLESFFGELDSFKTKFGYKLTGYSKVLGFENGDDKVVELTFSSDTHCWNMTDLLGQIKEVIDAFLSNVPEYAERMQSNETVT